VSLDLIIAYVLAKVEAGKDQDVLKEVRKLSGVQHAVPTYGVYDLHVEVSLKTMDELDSFVFEKIRRISGIKETITLIAFKGM
jgi:Lrp/AsnC family transcriptional regulator for asnA, asnC and gidA